MNGRSIRVSAFAAWFAVLGVMMLAAGLLRQPPRTEAKEPDSATLAKQYSDEVRPLLQKYCLDCHSTKARKGSLDLERFATAAEVRKDLKPWQMLLEQVEAGEMPPKK